MRDVPEVVLFVEVVAAVGLLAQVEGSEILRVLKARRRSSDFRLVKIQILPQSSFSCTLLCVTLQVGVHVQAESLRSDRTTVTVILDTIPRHWVGFEASVLVERQQ